MRRLLCCLLLCGSFVAALSSGHARDDKHHFSIAAALEGKDGRSKLDGSVKFFFGQQEIPVVLENLRNDVVVGKAHTRADSAERVCNTAFLSAMNQLEKRAKQLGANAVVKIVSYYKRVEMSSPTQFECHQGSRTTGVALKGDFVKLVEKKIAVHPYLHKEFE